MKLKIIKEEDNLVNVIRYYWYNFETKTKFAGSFSGVTYWVKDNITILGYGKSHDQPKGVGYEFIKLCVDDILDSGLGIISRNNGRCVASDIIWDKLSKEYEVLDVTIDGGKCKQILNRKL